MMSAHRPWSIIRALSHDESLGEGSNPGGERPPATREMTEMAGMKHGPHEM